MNNLVGKIFEDRKNSARKVVIKDYQVSTNNIEVVTIEFLDGCGKKAGTVENKFLKSFKKSWKETEEVIEEATEKVVEELEKVEEVVDTEKNLSDEDYAKIGVEITEQAKQKSNKITKKDSLEFIKSQYEKLLDFVTSNNFELKDGKKNNRYIIKSNVKSVSVNIRKSKLVCYVSGDVSSLGGVFKEGSNKTKFEFLDVSFIINLISVL